MCKCGGQVVDSVLKSAWQAMSPLVLFRGVDTAEVSIKLRWSSLTKQCSKKIIKCTYPDKKQLTFYSTKAIISARYEQLQPSLLHHIRRMYQVHTVTSLTAI
jgi:hypothetical protein